MEKSQEQLASGKRINRPSDDPVGLVYSLRLRTALTELDQYSSNAEDAKSWLDTTDSALDESGTILQRIRELAVNAASDQLTQTERDAITQEVQQLKQQLVQVGNTTYAGKYVFSGTQTLTASFDNTGAYQGNNGAINYEVGVGVQIPVNVDGAKAFGNMFTVIDNFLADLAPPGNAADISNNVLGQLDTEINNQLEVRAEVGARVNRLDLATNRMDSDKVNLTGLLSKTEDVDVAQLITQLKVQESVYNSSLAAGARIVQPTLMDFLR